MNAFIVARSGLKQAAISPLAAMRSMTVLSKQSAEEYKKLVRDDFHSVRLVELHH
jgi:hypothetical protein